MLIFAAVITDSAHTHPAPDVPLTDLSQHLDGVDPLSAEAFRAFTKTLRLHRRLLFGAMSDHDMHPGQAFCLRLVATNDGMAQRDLAAGLHVAAPTVSKMLRGMEQAGLVTRRADDADQRLTRVYLTDQGRALEARLREVAAAYVNDTIGILSEAERRQLARLLDRLAARIEAVLDERRAAPSEARRSSHKASA